MLKIKRIIENIKATPGLYLGKKSITLLKAFLDGYIEGIGKGDIYYLSEFQKFIEDEYPSNMSYSWANLILVNSDSEEEAFDKFFELYNDFSSKKVRE